MIFTRGRGQVTPTGGNVCRVEFTLYLFSSHINFLLILQTNKDNKEGHGNIRYQQLCGVQGSRKMFHVSL